MSSPVCVFVVFCLSASRKQGEFPHCCTNRNEICEIVTLARFIPRLLVETLGFSLQVKLPRPWQAVYDDDSGLYYYWNEETDEVTWQHPSEKVRSGWCTLSSPVFSFVNCRHNCLDHRLEPFGPWFGLQAKLDDEKLPEGWKKERDPETGASGFRERLRLKSWYALRTLSTLFRRGFLLEHHHG